MTRNHFHRAVALAKEFDQPITIGGGEPTLHPMFRDFVMHAVWELTDYTNNAGFPAVGMVTNGSNTEISLALAQLVIQGVISATVSHDDYHDPIDPRVYRAFEKQKDQSGKTREDDYRGVNRGGGYIMPLGRAKTWGNHPFSKCGCDSVFVTPKGKVFPCGCRVKPLGHLDDASIPLKYEHFNGYCQKDPEFDKKVAEGEG